MTSDHHLGVGQNRLGCMESIWTAWAAGQRGNETTQRSIAVTVECPQIDRVDGPASRRAADPQKPIAGGDRGADRRREQHRHPLGLALIPGSDQALRVLKHLGIGRAAPGSLFLGSLPALILLFAAVEAHCHSPNVIKSPVLRDQGDL